MIGQCTYNENQLRVANGFISNTNDFRVNSNGLASGSLVYSCAPGYSLDQTIGSRLTCQSNGIWTTLPICRCEYYRFTIGSLDLSNFWIATGRCPTSTLFSFIQNPSIGSTMNFNGSYSLPTDGVDNNSVVSGAYVPMMCNPGFVNNGGPLNITCSNGAWTPFPNCVSAPGSVTTLAPGGGINTGLPTTSGRCPYNSTTFNIDNGFPSNTSSLLMYPDTGTATGSESIERFLLMESCVLFQVGSCLDAPLVTD